MVELSSDTNLLKMFLLKYSYSTVLYAENNFKILSYNFSVFALWK